MKQNKQEKTLQEELIAKFGSLYKSKKGKKYLLEDDEKFCKPANNESSPYHDWQEKHGNYSQDKSQEVVEANPDILAESDSLYVHEEYIDEEQEQLIKENWQNLTEKQKQIVRMIGLEGKTTANVAAILDISRGNVVDILNRARKILRKNKNKKTS